MEEMLTTCRAENKELTLELSIEKRLRQIITVGFALFIIGMGLLSNCERQTSRVLSYQNDSLHRVIDSLHYEITMRDSALNKLYFWNRLATDKERKIQIKKDKLERHDKGIYIKK